MEDKIRERTHAGASEMRLIRVGQRYECENPALLPSGAWISIKTGNLFRSEEGKSITDIRSRESFVFLKVGDSPNIPLSQARTIAADHDVEPNF